MAPTGSFDTASQNARVVLAMGTALYSRFGAVKKGLRAWHRRRLA